MACLFSGGLSLPCSSAHFPCSFFFTHHVHLQLVSFVFAHKTWHWELPHMKSSCHDFSHPGGFDMSRKRSMEAPPEGLIAKRVLHYLSLMNRVFTGFNEFI